MCSATLPCSDFVNVELPLRKTCIHVISAKCCFCQFCFAGLILIAPDTLHFDLFCCWDTHSDAFLRCYSTLPCSDIVNVEMPSHF